VVPSSITLLFVMEFKKKTLGKLYFAGVNKPDISGTSIE
jgi:hypothetical protein